MSERKADGHVRAAVRTHRRHLAYFADQEQRGNGDPGQLLAVAGDRLLAAARHTTRPDRELRALADQVADQARGNADRAGMRPARIAHAEQAIRGARNGRERLGAALRWLRVAVRELPDRERRDKAAAAYARQLRGKALELLPQKPETPASRRG